MPMASRRPDLAVVALIDLLLAHYGTAHAPSVDYTMPNEAYFDHADWVLRRAAEEGFLVLLTPSYVGFDGGSQGWYAAMVANGPERLREYGEYLGRRYRDFDNILWVHGGDYDPPRKDLVQRHCGRDRRTFDPRALHTAHCAPETAAFEYWQEEPWLEVNNVYTYGPVCAAAVGAIRPARTDALLSDRERLRERAGVKRAAPAHAGLSCSPVRRRRPDLRQQPDLALRWPRYSSRTGDLARRAGQPRRAEHDPPPQPAGEHAVVAAAA